MEYKTVKEFASGEFVEKKSRFIGYINPVISEEEARDFLERIRKKHRDATHNVYAYAIAENNINKFSDDGEPAKTAGAPVMDVITGEGLTNVIIVVTRYFGGTLIGTGGLVKAYKQAAKIAVDASETVIMTESAEAVITSQYGMWQKIEKLLSDTGCVITKLEYRDEVGAVFICKNEEFPKISDGIVNLSNGTVKPYKTKTFYYGF